MILNYPKYYEKFKCIADKCSDTCCVGWQIVVDEKTAKKYEKLNNDFGKFIREKIVVDYEGDKIFENKNGRCPFLNNKNLCDIIINVGEEYLCRTCDMFPRFYETFGGTKEMGLFLSCPVANDLILKNEDFEIITEYSDEEPEINDIDADLYIALKSERAKIFKFITSEIPFGNKPKKLYNYALKLQEFLNKNDYENIKKLDFILDEKDLIIDKNIFSNLEYLKEENKKLFIKNSLTFEEKYEDEYINLLWYFIYKYFLKSVYSGKVFESIAFAVFSVKTINAMEKTYNISTSEASRIYGKEMEHSKENLDKIFEYLSK